jgi:hypothetical protein
MCYHYLDGDDAGIPYVGDNPAVDIVAAALALLETTGGEIDTDDEGIGPGPAYADDEEEMSDEEAAAFAEFKAQQAALRDDALGAPPADEEEGAFAAPSALALEQSAGPELSLDAVMSGAIPEHLHDADQGPPRENAEAGIDSGLSLGDEAPAAEAAEAADADLAPPPPMDGFGFDDGIDFSDPEALDDTALAPPVPEGLGGLDDDDAEPAAAPPAAEPAQQASEQETDGEALGGWSLKFDEEK